MAEVKADAALAPPAATSPTERVCDGIAVAILTVAALVAALTFRDFGLSWDDFTHSEYGDLLLAFFTSGFSDRRVFSFVNLYLYGGGFDMAAALLAKILPFDLFETRRLTGALVGLVGLAVTWRIGRRLGGPLAGLVALILLATCPLYVGHMFMNPKDAPFATATAILLLGLVRVLEDYPRPRLGSALVFALGVGLAIGTRILAGFDALAAGAALLLVLAIESRRDGWASAWPRMGQFLLRLLPALLLAYAIMALVWPWAVIDPSNPVRAIVYFSEFFEKPWRELFNGRLILVPDMPRSYIPLLALHKLPEILLALGLSGLIGALVAAAWSDRPANRRAVLFVVALAALLPVVISVLTRPAMYNGLRHFVFVLPPLAALGGLAAAELARLLHHRRPMLVAGATVLALGAASPVIEMARLHPYEYTAFNRVTGGAQAASTRFMLDYWGLSFKQAGAALRDIAHRQPSPGRPWKVAVCGPHPPAKVALGPGFEVSWNPTDADFAMMLGVLYCRDLPAPIIGEVVREGIVYARLYDLRGVKVDNLLTVPGL